MDRYHPSWRWEHLYNKQPFPGPVKRCFSCYFLWLESRNQPTLNQARFMPRGRAVWVGAACPRHCCRPRPGGASGPEASSAGSRRFPCPRGSLVAGPGSPGWDEAPQGRPSHTGCPARARGPACVGLLGLFFSLMCKFLSSFSCGINNKHGSVVINNRNSQASLLVKTSEHRLAGGAAARSSVFLSSGRGKLSPRGIL